MKDAKGHGSSGRGYARQAPTKNGRARYYGTSMADRVKIAQDQQNIKEGRVAGTPGNPLGFAPGVNSSSPHDGVTNNGGGYYARASARGGNKLGEYGPHTDRDAAAAEAWQKHPNARQVSTTRGPYGMDTQWHNSPDGSRGRAGGFGRNGA